MRTAVISDIHGNAVAFEAVLADLERDPVDQVVCLGDVAQGGPQPAEAIDLLLTLDCPCVIGNADAFLLDASASAEPVAEAQLEAREWSRLRLGPERLEVLGRFTPTVALDLARHGVRLLGFHGSPASYDDVILPELSEDEFRRLLGPPAAELMCGGHTHLQWLRRYGETTFFNPGSVGLGYDHEQPEDDFHFDSFAAYARVGVEEGQIEVSFRRVGFDPRLVTDAIRENGFPHGDELIARWQPPAA